MKVYTVHELLDQQSINILTNVADLEIREALDMSVPKYQSQGPQHLKHPDCEPLQELCNKVVKIASDLTGSKMKISNCWFVISREDSKFNFHTHTGEQISAVYYLKNCTGNGTIFESFFTKLQALSEDNSLILFDPEIMHSVPQWNGQDRYTIAFDLGYENGDC